MIRKQMEKGTSDLASSNGGPIQPSNGSNSNRPYRILVVDNHFVARHGLKDALSFMRGVEICGEAATGPDAIELAKSTRPNLVMLDLSLPEVNGFEVARSIRETLPDTDVLVLTHHESPELAKAGAIKPAGSMPSYR